MEYAEWAETVPTAIRGDSLWKMEAYRLALFAGDISWDDLIPLMKDRRTVSLSDQLFRAADPSTPICPKAILVARGEIALDSTSMRSVLLGSRVVGIIKAGMSWAPRERTIDCDYSHKSFVSS